MARLVRWDDPAAFRARAEPALLRHEAENNLLFGILHGIERGTYADHVLLTLEEDDEVTAVAMRTPPHNLVLSYAGEQAARALAAAVEGPLPGVNAEAGIARAFCEAWVARHGGSFERSMAQRVYALERVDRPADVPGVPRWADERDAPLLVEWFTAFEQEALPHHDVNRGDSAARVERFLADPMLGIMLWESAGVPVTMAGHSGPTPNGMRVGPVYTPPPLRKKGYASACVAELSARLLADGRRFCFLYTDLSNPTSNAIYRAVGYRPVCDAAEYRFSAR